MATCSQNVESAGICGLTGAFYRRLFFAWHMAVPLRFLLVDRLSLREAIASLGLSHFDAKGFFLVMPMVFRCRHAVASVQILVYAALASDRVDRRLESSRLQHFSGSHHVTRFVSGWVSGDWICGQFLCEELYFHGYLMKKIGFLGPWAGVVNSLLFGRWSAILGALT